MENNNKFFTVGILMMIKNEENSIEISLNSIKDYFQHIIIYDTGSTDNSINILKNICDKNKLMLYLKIGQFTPLKI
jgi:glycosyltransferase involved in cell wall biosynthesis